MATKTIYTSTMTIPIYASWKCEKCGKTNFSTGSMVCSRQNSTSSWSPSRQQEVKEHTRNQVSVEWIGETYRIIIDPKNNAQNMRAGLFLQNTRCSQCRKKPRWDKNMRYVTWGTLCMFPTIISGILAIANATNPVAWLVFSGLLAIVITAIISEPRYKKMMKKLPKEYTPVIGSLHPDLVNHARLLKTTIPTPEECIATVMGYSGDANISSNNSQPDKAK